MEDIDTILKNNKLARLIKASRLPDITQNTHRLSNFSVTDDNRAGFETSCDYIPIHYNLKDFKDVEYDNWHYSHHFLTIYGPPGTGKTHLAIGIGWEILERELGKVIYYNTQNLLDELRGAFDDSKTFNDIIYSLKNYELVILDDIGAQHNTPWATSKLDELIDYRYINSLETIFTTNIPADKLPDRLASRLSEGEIIDFEGIGDYRLMIRKQREYKKTHKVKK